MYNYYIPMNQKQELDQDQEILQGIFSLKCYNGNNKAKINHLENVMLKKTEIIADTLVKEFPIIDGVIGEIYTCNITNTFLMSTRKLPVLYINITHQKPIQKFLLYRVYLYFTITSQIKSVKDLLDRKVEGKYSMEISIDDKKKEIDDPLTQYPGDTKMYEKLENFAKADSMKALTVSLVNEINERMKLEYGKELEHFMKKPDSYISLKNYKL